MSMDHDLRGNRRRRRARYATGATITGAGAWGVLIDDPEETGESRVRVGDQAMGPVPVISLLPDASPAKGDRVFLHVDTTGQPAYAALITI